MTKVEPNRAFRRFPWIQLAFCLACLSMAAWTWMRYSYPLDVTPAGLPQSVDDPGWENWQGRYVRLSGHYLSDHTHRLNDDGRYFGFVCDDERATIEVVSYARIPRDHDASFTGRVCGLADILGPNSSVGSKDTYVDGRASRFHPASIAGLVVGAMGCFIFGLYLRQWLGKRKALARAPEQDMIA